MLSKSPIPSPNILPVGSRLLSKAFPEKDSPPGLGCLSNQSSGSGDLGRGEGVLCECVCVWGGERVGKEAGTGPEQGLRVVNICSANKSLSKGE